MKVHEIAAEMRAVAERMRRAHRSELRDQDAVEFLSERAGEVDRLANLLVSSLDARNAETKAGHPMRPKFQGGEVRTESGRVIRAETLFKFKASASA